MRNEMRLSFPARKGNEALARMAIAAFVAPLDPTLDELAELKTAVSEAVTNAIIHAYPDGEGWVSVEAVLEGDLLTLVVRDEGVGIADVEEARQPLFTTRADLERSGMGFVIMENFMDSVEVESSPGKGTVVRMTKRFATRSSDREAKVE
ncbi:anti-sigma F factor [Brockia lithotrophica]|uniref:Anti-sigma F factor n=1 Tax=Brockia lithotrophica TaxID=933949 RepID=A0A660L3Y8_9BACL|nr:anti-sigma F factor [Brockia lithotrophica]RKQ88657.1 stage II sporulation protein AB (anti-sigma F factor) [Brockia lithotrophica]